MKDRKLRLRSQRLQSQNSLQDQLDRTPVSSSPRLLKIHASVLLRTSDSLTFGNAFANTTIQFGRYVKLKRYESPTQKRPFLVFGSVDGAPSAAGPLCSAVLEPGMTELYTTDSSEWLEAQYFFLYEEGKIETHATAIVNPDRNIGGELVYGTRDESDPELVLAKEPLTQFYGSGALLSELPAEVVVTKNLTVRGLRIQGKNQLGFGPWVVFGWIDGLKVVECHGVEGMTVGFSFQFCRNVIVKHCSGRFLPKLPPPLDTNPWGYTFQVNHSVDVLVEACMAHRAQYTLTIEGGSAATTAKNLYYSSFSTAYSDTSDQSCFDIHGGEAYNISVELATSPGVGISLGNASWRRGASHVVLSNCTFTRLRIVSGIHDLDVVDCNCENVKYEYISEDPNAGSWNSNPINHTFLRTKINMPSSHPDGYAVSMPANGSVDQSQYKIDGLTFSECEITNDDNSAVLVVGANTKSASSISFDTCTLTLPGSAASNDAIIILTSAQSPTPVSLSLFVYGTVFLMANNQEIASGTSATTTTKFFDDGQNLRGPAMNDLREICRDDLSGMDKSTLPLCEA